MLGSLCSLPWEPKRWAPRGLGPRVLQTFSLLCYQSLSGDTLVGPLQHLWHNRWGSLNKRPKEAGRPDPIMNAWIINDGCASGMALISFMKRVRYGSRGSSSFCLISRRDVAVGFGRVLARKLASNSLAS
ncbi:hypothetical protein BHM03_00049186 [Ensete ventricosum]|nr:hypothetical protein BHM03_00049186 [Ensete ventricosum]